MAPEWGPFCFGRLGLMSLSRVGKRVNGTRGRIAGTTFLGVRVNAVEDGGPKLLPSSFISSPTYSHHIPHKDGSASPAILRQSALIRSLVPGVVGARAARILLATGNRLSFRCDPKVITTICCDVTRYGTAFNFCLTAPDDADGVARIGESNGEHLRPYAGCGRYAEVESGTL